MDINCFKETCLKGEILCSFLQNSEKKSHKFDFKRILPRNLLKNQAIGWNHRFPYKKLSVKLVSDIKIDGKMAAILPFYCSVYMNYGVTI